MNLVLLEPGELSPDGTAHLTGRRARHVAEVLRGAVGDSIAVGLIGGSTGTARVESVTADLASSATVPTRAARLSLRVTLDRPPPAPSPVTLLLALPRPKILRKVLQATGAMGVKRLILLGSWKVEKSYWGSPLLEPSGLREELLLGLEQGRDTVLPEVTLRRYFKPFVEDELEALLPGPRLLLDLAATRPLHALPAPPAGGVTLAIGPEGGWTGYEAAELEKRGFQPVSLGPRPLRVDQAVPFAVGQAEHWLAAGGTATAAGSPR